jgi:hypothetical protein
MYIKVSQLPNIIQEALRNKSYFRKDISVKTATRVSPHVSGNKGVRGYVVVCDLTINQIVINTLGSWGGASMFNPTNQVDLNTNYYDLSPEKVVIKGTVGWHNYACLTVHPDAMPRLLPDKPIELTQWEQAAIDIICGIKGGQYRREEFSRRGLGAYDYTRTEIRALKDKGLITISKNGAITITTAGRNARGDSL